MYHLCKGLPILGPYSGGCTVMGTFLFLELTGTRGWKKIRFTATPQLSETSLSSWSHCYSIGFHIGQRRRRVLFLWNLQWKGGE